MYLYDFFLKRLQLYSQNLFLKVALIVGPMLFMKVFHNLIMLYYFLLLESFH